MFAQADILVDPHPDALVAHFVEVLEVTEHNEQVGLDVVVCAHLLRKLLFGMKL
jgi:hypothetical protein